MQTGAATVENNMECPQKTEDETAFWSSDPIAGTKPEESWITSSKETMHPNVHRSTIYNTKVPETA